MNFKETSDFLDHINEHTEQEIMLNMQDIKEHFRWIPWNFTKDYLDKILKIVDKNTVLYELFKDEQRFSWWKEKIVFPENLKFGLEIEVANVPLDEIQCIFDSNAIVLIMNILEVPTDISNAIIENSILKRKMSLINGFFLQKQLKNQKHLHQL